MVARCHCHDLTQATEFVEGHIRYLCFKAERAFGDTLQVRIEESEGSLDGCLLKDVWSCGIGWIFCHLFFYTVG
jgi:hypothetical protein